jgi:hypothetical protein
MRKHPVRKIIGLTVLYAVLIVGIFILQFKSESVISKNIGGMHISLAQTEDENEELVLKNQFRISYKGITFTGDSENPVKAYSSYSRRYEDLKLVSFSEPNNLSVLFNFSDGSVLCFSLSDYSEDASLYINSIPAKGNDQLLLTYTTDKSVKLDSQAANRVVVNHKAYKMAIISSEVNLNTITMSGSEGMATFAPYDPAKRFTFDQLAGQEDADENLYDNNIKSLRGKLVTAVNQALAAKNYDVLTEGAVAAYIAELSSAGRFNEAISAIPDSYKRGSRRTYYTSPFFGNLADNYRSLSVENESSESRANAALSTTNADIFTVHNIPDYLLREKWKEKTIQLLSFPKQMLEAGIFEPTPHQAAGIIWTYTELYKKDIILASLLEKPVNFCIEMLENLCTLEDGSFNFKADLSFIEEIELGQALIALGQKDGRSDYKEAGRLFVNRAIKAKADSNEEIELSVLSELYPVVVTDNYYFPHVEILGYYGSEAVWAWTCAESISYSKEGSGTANVNIKFPLNYSHYLYIQGVPDFHAQIEIQSVMFRSDPRFEAYNSSGYIYRAANKVLMLKSRHRSNVELIRLFCDPTNTFVTADTPVNVTDNADL